MEMPRVTVEIEEELICIVQTYDKGTEDEDDEVIMISPKDVSELIDALLRAKIKLDGG